MERKGRGVFSKVCVIALVVVFCFGGISAYAVDTVSDFTGETYIHNRVFDDKLIVNGIDVSVYQKEIDWKAVKSSGVDFAIIRVGGRGYGEDGRLYDDSKFSEYYSGAREAGLMVGAYFFSQAISAREAKEEVAYAVELLAGRPLDLPLYMDYEYSGDDGGRILKSGISKVEASAVAQVFMKETEAKGYKSGLYANTRFLTDTVYGETLGQNYDVWVAQYYDKCLHDGKYNMWQYSSEGKVPGIEGVADCNFWYLEKDSANTSDKSMVNAEISFANPELSYSYLEGAAFRPIVRVKLNGRTLQEGVDYSVGYLHNTLPGMAYVMVSGMGAYTDYKLYPFQIAPTLGSGHTIAGTVRSYGDSKDDVTTMQLMVEGDKSPWYEWTMKGFRGDYSLPDLPDGKYTMLISKNRHIPETMEVVVRGRDVSLSPSIYSFGDINKDGKVDNDDAYVQGWQSVYSIPLTDKYSYRIRIKKNKG